MSAFIAGNRRERDVPTGSVEYKTIFAVGATLFVMTLIVNAVSIRLVRKYREVYRMSVAVSDAPVRAAADAVSSGAGCSSSRCFGSRWRSAVLALGTLFFDVLSKIRRDLDRDAPHESAPSSIT